MQDYDPGEAQDAFGASRAVFAQITEYLSGPQAGRVTHAQLEEQLAARGRELVRQLYQDSLDLRAAREQRLEVTDADGWGRGTAERRRSRELATVFGQVSVTRIAYREPGLPDLAPADAMLNLPVEKHSHGLRKLAALEAARGSFEQAAAAIGRATGVRLGKRQVEALATAAATDIDAFYTDRQQPKAGADDVLVLSFDGKGIVMRPDGLRAATAAKATSRKLAGRLSKGEKRARKRMAEVAAVYDLTPAVRTVGDILPDTDAERATAAPAPRASSKWLTASVVDDASEVIAAGFDQADRRDPHHRRTWIALVDGNAHQIARIRAEARTRKQTVTIVVDFIHVLEYLWKATWCFHAEADPKAEKWVRGHARAILEGKAATVAAAIRRKATYQQLDPKQREPADTAAGYLHNNKRWLDYPTALASGWPIATGVIEGACRHLVKDRMDITGARWGLDGAETILKLRALTTNGDFDNYWTYHLTQEQLHIHNSRYLSGVIPDG